uniref:Plus3 domain-containing protein n=1 Tax=Ditylenchus dipsaci TaxID=166011 RepID=A0A915DMU8_9BILA
MDASNRNNGNASNVSIGAIKKEVLEVNAAKKTPSSSTCKNILPASDIKVVGAKRGNSKKLATVKKELTVDVVAAEGEVAAKKSRIQPNDPSNSKPVEKTPSSSHTASASTSIDKTTEKTLLNANKPASMTESASLSVMQQNEMDKIQAHQNLIKQCRENSAAWMSIVAKYLAQILNVAYSLAKDEAQCVTSSFKNVQLRRPDATTITFSNIEFVSSTELTHEEFMIWIFIADSKVLSREDLLRCTLSQSQLLQFINEIFFADVVIGCFVRFQVSKNKYCIYQISSVEEANAEYCIDGVTFYRQFFLKTSLKESRETCKMLQTVPSLKQNLSDGLMMAIQKLYFTVNATQTACEPPIPKVTAKKSKTAQPTPKATAKKSKTAQPPPKATAKKSLISQPTPKATANKSKTVQPKPEATAKKSMILQPTSDTRVFAQNIRNAHLNPSFTSALANASTECYFRSHPSFAKPCPLNTVYPHDQRPIHPDFGYPAPVQAFNYNPQTCNMQVNFYSAQPPPLLPQLVSQNQLNVRPQQRGFDSAPVRAVPNAVPPLAATPKPPNNTWKSIPIATATAASASLPQQKPKPVNIEVITLEDELTGEETISRLIRDGKMAEAIACIERKFPKLLGSNQQLALLLKIQQYVEVAKEASKDKQKDQAELGESITRLSHAMGDHPYVSRTNDALSLIFGTNEKNSYLLTQERRDNLARLVTNSIIVA